MNILLITLIFIVLVMVSGGFWFYFNIFKKLLKEFREFVQITFEALKDRKLTVVEKEKMLKEWSDLKPYTKEIKTKFVDDVKDLGDDIKEIYLNIKSLVKKKK